MSLFGRGRPKRYNVLKKKGSEPPVYPGLYRILDQSKTIKYIGMTNDLNRRMYEHMRSEKICEERPFFDWQQVQNEGTYAELRQIEAKKIKKHNPELNKTNNSVGRLPTITEFEIPYDSTGKAVEEYLLSNDATIEDLTSSNIVQTAKKGLPFRVMKKFLKRLFILIIIAVILYFVVPLILARM